MSEYAKYPSLIGQLVFITGGATGIGAAMVEAFAEQGARVAFVDLDSAPANILVSKLEKSTGTGPWFRQLDVTDTDALQEAIRDATEEFGPLYALVNNAANDNRHSPDQVTQQGWRDCMAINLECMPSDVG